MSAYGRCPLLAGVRLYIYTFKNNFFIIFIMYIVAFQPVIHEPLSKPEHSVQQNGINGADVAEVNGDTSHEVPVHTRESQGE